MRGDIPYDKPWVRSKSLMWENTRLKDFITPDRVFAGLLISAFILCVYVLLLFGNI